MKNLIQTLRALSGFCAVSGNEKACLAYIRGQLEEYSDDVFVDAMGNLFLSVGKNRGEKVLFSAHADTVGLIAHCADEKGFICVSAVGEPSLSHLPGSHVCFSCGIEGVVIKETNTNQELSWTDLRIDVGACDRAQAEKLVPPGSFCAIMGDYFASADNGRIFGPYMDNRLGVVLLMQVLRAVSDKKDCLKNELCFVFSVQEELGARGAAPAAYIAAPKYAVTVDAVRCSVPETSVVCGGGACVKIMDKNVCCHSEMVDFLRSAAQKKEILHQYEVSALSDTAAGAVQRARAGVYTGAVGIPVRYQHTPTESASISDFIKVKKLITESILTGFTF